MPYISEDRRKKLAPPWRGPSNAGELNYTITQAVLDYLDHHDDEKSYAYYNEVIGVLECVKQELYRRRIIPYENYKKYLNGDVF